MKKALSKPISSPSRTEKFPPPLMRFLRSNTGNKSSRRRSLSSPMFMRKKNPTGTAVNIETTQEPSSPKVTCIGQVRVRKSSKSKNSSTSSKPKRSNSSRTNLDDKQKEKPCWWIRKALCYCRFPSVRACRCTKFSRPFSRRWGLFGCCKMVDDDTRDDSSRVESIPRNMNNISSKIENNDHIVTSTTIEEAQVEESSKEVLHSSTPPRNALLLTRCRSAPYRSSSLASRFWGSPLKGVEDNDDHEKIQVLQELHGGVDHHQEDDHEAAETRLSNNQSHQEMESSVNDSTVEAKSIQDLRGVVVGGAAVHPLLLTRCKSEPARTGERLMNPDSSFWKQRRLEVSDEASSQHNCD